MVDDSEVSWVSEQYITETPVTMIDPFVKCRHIFRPIPISQGSKKFSHCCIWCSPMTDLKFLKELGYARSIDPNA
jgi:hypothetical protein